jgi:hypothetical protein
VKQHGHHDAAKDHEKDVESLVGEPKQYYCENQKPDSDDRSPSKSLRR